MPRHTPQEKFRRALEEAGVTEADLSDGELQALKQWAGLPQRRAPVTAPGAGALQQVRRPPPPAEPPPDMELSPFMRGVQPGGQPIEPPRGFLRPDAGAFLREPQGEGLERRIPQFGPIPEAALDIGVAPLDAFFEGLVQNVSTPLDDPRRSRSFAENVEGFRERPAWQQILLGLIDPTIGASRLPATAGRAGLSNIKQIPVQAPELLAPSQRQVRGLGRQPTLPSPSVAPQQVTPPVAAPRQRTVDELLRLGGYTPPVQSVDTVVEQERRVASTMRRLAAELEGAADEDLLARFSVDDIEERLNVDLPRRTDNPDVLDASASRFLREEADRIERDIPRRVEARESFDLERRERVMGRALEEFGPEELPPSPMEDLGRGQLELPEEIAPEPVEDALELAQRRLDEAQANLEAVSARGAPAPRFGTREAAEEAARRRTAAAEGRRIIPKTEQRRLARQEVQSAREEVRRLETEALERASPRGVAPRVNNAPTGFVRPAAIERDPRLSPSPAGQELITSADELAGTPRAPGVSVTPQAARAELDSALYEAIPDSPVDVAASRFFREGDLRRYVSDSPPNIPVSPEFATYEFRHINRVNANSLDPTRLLQTIDNGVFNGPLQRGVLWPTRRTFLASMKFGHEERTVFEASLDAFGMHGIRNRELRELSGDVLEYIGSQDTRASVGELMQRPEISRLVRGRNASDRERIVGFAQDARRILDELLEMQNLARVKRGQEQIPTLQNYKPWIIDTNIWNRLGFSKKLPAEVMDQPLTPDFIKPDAPFNPRAQARTEGLANYPRERDLRRLVDDYIDTATRDIFHTDIIRNAKAHTRVLRERGFEVPASAVDSWISEAFAGSQTPFTKAVRDLAPRPAVELVLLVRRSLTRAVFPLNWTWNLGIQTSSLVPTLSRYGPINTFRGLDYILSPAARRWTRENVYSSIVKSRRGGRISEQALGYGNTPELSGRLNTSPLDTATDIMNFLTNVIEDNLTGVSVRAAYHNGQTRGLTGRALTEWASEGGSKTQSMYNIHDRPGWLRSQELQAIAPFQTFAFEMFNTVREMFTPVGRVGAFQSIARGPKERLRQLLTFIGGMYAFNMAGEAYLDRKPWVVGSFLPFYGLLVGGMNPGSPLGEALPRQYQKDAWEGFRDIIRRGDWGRFRRWLTRYHVPAGTQVSRSVEGLLAVSQGGVSDTAGRELFEVDPDEWFTALTRGPYATEEGQEWVQKQRERRGPFSDILGFEVPMPVEEPKPIPPHFRNLPPEILEGLGFEVENRGSSFDPFRNLPPDIRERIGR